MSKSPWVLVVAVAALSFAPYMGPRLVPAPGTVVGSCRAVVDGLASLQQRDKYPQFGDGGRLVVDETFDVQSYLSVLTHLSMEDGYCLSYIYHSSQLCAEPILTAVRAESCEALPFVRNSELPSYLSCMGDPHEDEPWSPRHQYLRHVQVDDSEEGYFEYVVLYVMAERFFQYWHAMYNDYSVVCDPHTLDESVRGSRGQCLFGGLCSLVGKMSRLEPRVELLGDTARVTVVVHSRSGLNEETFTLSRKFPHTILEHEVDPLVVTYCFAYY